MADLQVGGQFSGDIRRPCGYTAGHLTHTRTDHDYMSGFREPGFADRQKAAQQAKQAILEKFRAQPGADDPAVKERQAEREAQAAARAKAKEAREAEKAAKKAEEERLAAEAAAQAAREKEEAAARETALEAERKAARDARYAARKKKRK
jgi:hypothetical protein